MKDPIRRRSILSRADLLGVFATGETSAINYLANKLVLEQRNITLDNENEESINFFTKDRIIKAMRKAFVEVESQSNFVQDLKPTAGFWLLERREATTLEVAQEDEAEFSTFAGWRERPDIAPVYYPLVSPRSLLPRLFHHLKHQRQGCAVDVDAVVRKLGRGEYLYHIPRASRRSLGRHLHVIDDRHLHLIPYWTDQGLFASLLGSFLPDYASSHDVLIEGQSAGWSLPPQNSVVVVFSDLGALSEQPTEHIAVWLRIGRELQRLGCKLIAVLPCHPDECDPRLREFFTLESWEPLRQLEKLSKAQRRQQANELLALLAPAIRLEPGLLRSVRLAVARHGYHFSTGVEAAVWQHPDMVEPSSIAATFSQAARNRWLDTFAALEDDAVKQTVLDTIREWRSPLRQHVWFEEITSLDGDSRCLVSHSDLVDAKQYFQHLSQRYESDTLALQADSATRSWFQRMEQRLPQGSWDLPEVGTALQRIAAQVHKNESQFCTEHPIDPAKLTSSELPEQIVEIYQQGENLLLGSPQDTGLVIGSPVGQIRLRRGLVYLESFSEVEGNVPSKVLFRQSFQFQCSTDEVEITLPPDVAGLMLRSDVETLYFKQITKPIWASRFWRDQDGVFAETISNEGDEYKWAWYPAEKSKYEDKCKRGVWYFPKLKYLLGRRPRVYLSYGRSRETKDLIDGVIDDLRQDGFDVYYDKLMALSDEVAIVGELIKNSDVVVFLLTRKSLQSMYIRQEFELSRKLKSYIIPVLIENIPLELMPESWAGLLHRDLSGSISIRSDLRLHMRQEYPDFFRTHQLVIPKWAQTLGHDQYGFYADLNLMESIQRFRWIEPGTFLMGSPETEADREPWVKGSETQHQVTLTQGFWLADTTVTQAQWLAVMGNNPSHFSDNPNNPVEQINWNDTQDFIQKLNTLIPNLQAKLPTEAQWEYACRAGTTTPFSFGNNITPEQVNYDGNKPYANGKKGLYREKTVPVKSLPANPWDLHEMHGNVWEWCQDAWQAKLSATSVTDPENVDGGDQAGVERVVRGGSWGGDGRGVRSAFRNGHVSGDRFYRIGFRLVLGHFELRRGQGGGVAGSEATSHHSGADGNDAIPAKDPHPNPFPRGGGAKK